MKALTIMLAFLFLLPGPQFAAAQDAPDGAWTGVTLLLTDGWRYRDVTVYLDGHGAGLWVQRPDGAERLVSTDKVTRIIGPDGDDITADVLAGARSATPPVAPPVDAAPEAPAEAWDGVFEPTAMKASTAAPVERPFKLAFTLEGGFGFPLCDRYDGFRPSWSAGARLRIGTSKQSYLGLGYRYQDLSMVTIFGYSPDDASAHAEIYEATFGFMSGGQGHGPRSYFELGAAFLDQAYTYDNGYDRRSLSHQYGAFVLRSGVLAPLGEAFALDFGVSLTYTGLIFADEYESTGSLVGVHLGLTWLN